jgi:hypothetical protein
MEEESGPALIWLEKYLFKYTTQEIWHRTVSCERRLDVGQDIRIDIRCKLVFVVNVTGVARILWGFGTLSGKFL